MDNKVIAKLDQLVADIRHTYPPMVWAFYDECWKVGFTRDQAFQLARDWLELSMIQASDRCIMEDGEND